jgi:hypothetical protein
MFLKGKIKLRIIQVYLHAHISSDSRNDILDVRQKLLEMVNQAYLQNYKLIVMGDFNVDPKILYAHLDNGSNVPWQYNILHSLIDFNMHDTVDLCHDIDIRNPYNTYISVQHNQSNSRLDLIWISHDLTRELLASNNLDHDLYTSDHVAVYASFYTDNIFKRHSYASMRQQKMKKLVFSYNNMNAELWDNFSSATDNHPKINELQDMHLNSQSNLNHYWSVFQTIIIDCAKKFIPNRMTTAQYKDKTPEHMTLAHNNIKKLNKLLSYTHHKSFF